MGAKLLAAIEALKKTPWVILALLFASLVGGVAQFTGATKMLFELVRPAKADARAELGKLGISFTPEALATAAKNGDARVVGLLLDAGMAADPQPPLPVSPLVLAADGGHLNASRRLRDAGSDPATPGEADTALERAAKADYPALVALFLERRLPPAAVADAYVDAAVADNPKVLALLAPHLADPRATARDAIAATLERTPTRLSPMTTEQAELVTKYPDRPELAILGRTIGDPASFAALHAVLALKPPLDVLDANHQTLLHKAVENDASGMVAILLAAGAKPDTLARCGDEDDDSRSPPLACASQRGSSTGLASARALLAAHATVDARTTLGITPLMLAADGGDAQMVAALLAAGADPAARDPQGHTAADHAAKARFNDPAATRELLSQAAARRRS